MPKSKKQGQPFWLGGAAASMAACFTHPLDQTKYRMQVMATRQNMLRTMMQFASRDGILSLWWGISASMLRQSTYSTARFGLYNHFANKARERSGATRLTSGWEVVCAGAAGGLAGLIGNPTEVALVRMCADGAKSPAQRFGYKHAFDAILRIGREEGIQTFTRGLGPNVVRSVIMNIPQRSAGFFQTRRSASKTAYLHTFSLPWLQARSRQLLAHQRMC
ncbi:putative 2-oxoglutarate/malate carrier protein [Cladophialophora carrionii]|uniref:Putative 2-oxoglutarate/malate carrier protein n=1 Tax=Cladophialophora carrionii TaxID=86049 RepID=A0A1C1CSK9_9EURO|nr:putative 2-oxoglutarate/malate carrier protein [Cladophialophora carrionii]